LELVTRLTRRTGSLALVVAAAAGCSGEDRTVPSVLVDGAPARPPPVTLEGVDDATVASRVRVLRSGSLRSGWQIGRCVSASAPADPGNGVVERVGVSGASITFSDSLRRELRGCDATRVREAGGSTIWCGHAFARLRAGRLRDPRLSLTCRDDHGDPLGFAWIQPGSGAAYVVVAHSGYHEVHRVVAGLPVRVTTDDVDPAAASATLVVGEHGRDGRRLRSYEVEARVSG
jgi:hypothetical protein